MAKEVIRVEFKPGARTKLVPKHKHISAAVRESGKSIGELMSDPFGGYPYLLRALLKEGWDPMKPLTIDMCSDLIDDYSELHGGMTGLTEALIKSLSLYLHIESTPAKDEEDEDGVRPPQDGPAMTEPSAA